MTERNQESILDIVSEMREFADTDSQTIGRDVLRKQIQDFARRIEQSVYQIAKEALSSKQRNCDKYTLEEAFHKYGSPTKGHPWEEIEWLDFLEWLFSEAKDD